MRRRLISAAGAILAVSIALAGGIAVARLPAIRAAAARVQPDLVVSSVTSSPGTLRPGGSLTIRDKVRNRGRARARNFTVAYYLARPSPSGPVRVTTRTIALIRWHGSSSATTAARLPAALKAGTYRLLACADDPSKVVESDEHNNCRTATAPVHVVPGDTARPVSRASSPAYTRSDRVPIEYTADGTGSALTRVELWVRTPGASSFARVQTDASPATGARHFDYTADADGAYAFYTRAVDRAGNAEVAPATPDTTTVVDLTAPSSQATALALTNSPSIRVDYTADGTGTPLDRVELWVKAPNASAFALSATDSAPSASGHFDYTASLGDGDYRFVTIAYDRAGNAEPAPGAPDATTTLDTAPPSVTIDQPGEGSTTDLLALAGHSGTASGDADAVTVNLYSGTGTNGVLLQNPAATVTSGSWTAAANPLATGTYTLQVTQQDAAGNTGQATHTFTMPTTVLAAGDIAGPPAAPANPPEGDGSATSPLITQRAGTVLALGDNEYETSGQPTLQDFMNYYDKTWGLFKSRTMPVPGNHEYRGATTAPGYFSYFGPVAGDPAKGYYSYDLGSWHVVALNSGNDCSAAIVSCAAGSTQETWLRTDLSQHSTQCILAYWHHPLFSSSLVDSQNQPVKDGAVQPLFKALYDYHADIVLNGHQHNYERFALQDVNGNADAQGIREFVVGSGGRDHEAFPSPARFARSEASDGSTFGILDLTLGAGTYSWQFVPEAGGTFTDQGSGTCHNVSSGP